MNYVTTWPLFISGRLVAELDIRATIVGELDYWAVSTIAMDEINGRGRNAWFKLPCDHLYWAEIVEWLQSPDMAWRVEADYRDYLIGQADAAREDERDEHRLTKRESAP